MLLEDALKISRNVGDLLDAMTTHKRFDSEKFYKVRTYIVPEHVRSYPKRKKQTTKSNVIPLRRRA